MSGVSIRNLVKKYAGVGAVNGVQSGDAGQVVVIGQHDELVAVLPVPRDHGIRRGITITIQSVRVQVAFEPDGLRLEAWVLRRSHDSNRRT